MIDWLTRPRVCLLSGVVLLVAGLIDPLEGCVLIVIGSLCGVKAAATAHDPRRNRQLLAFTLVVIGVLTMFGWSAAGGMGGTSGRSVWWVLTLLPYPMGWILALVVTVQMLGRPWREDATPALRLIDARRSRVGASAAAVRKDHLAAHSVCARSHCG